MKQLHPIHPGEVLRTEFMEPKRITAYRLAEDISVPAPRMYDIIREKRAITADTALRLARYFGTTPEFWMNLQSHYDLQREERVLGSRLEKDVHVLA